MFNSKFLDPNFKALTSLIINEFNNASNCKEYPNIIEPDTDIFESEKDYKVMVSIPGIDPNNIDIRVNEGERLLTIRTFNEKFDNKDSSGEMAAGNVSDQLQENYEQNEEEKKEDSSHFKYLSTQIYEGNYFKEVKFPNSIKETDIVTSYENGILTINLNKKK